jgi:hypothetical protein
MTQLYDDRLWPYAQLGIVLPAFRSREEAGEPAGCSAAATASSMRYRSSSGPPIDYLVTQGVPVPDARDYNIAGCLSVSLTGQSRQARRPMSRRLQPPAHQSEP